MSNNFILNRINSYKDTFYIVLIWILFTSTYPFEFYSVVPNHPYKILAFFIVFFIFLLILNKYRIKFNIIFFLILIQAFYSLLSIPIHVYTIDLFYLNDGLIYFKLFIQFIVAFIVYQFICLYKLKEKLALSIVYMMVLMSFLGFINLFLGIFINIEPFSKTYIDNHRDIYNFILTFSSSISSYNNFKIIRSSGFFDEPGTMAFYTVLALVLNKIYNFSNKLGYALIIFGLSTLSMAFFISVFFLISISLIFEKKFFKLILFFISLVIIYLLLYYYKDNSFLIRGLYELSFMRFEAADVDSNALLKGDNRSEHLIFALKAFLEAPLFGYGMNAHTNEKIDYFGKICCNPFHPLATEGIIGFLIFYSPYIYWTILVFMNPYKDRVLYLCWFLIFLNFLQRPGFNAGSFGTLFFIYLIDATKFRLSNFVNTNK